MSDIRDLRSRLGMSQEELGVALGVSGRTVRRWEQGKTISRLARRNLEFLSSRYPRTKRGLP